MTSRRCRLPICLYTYMLNIFVWLAGRLVDGAVHIRPQSFVRNGETDAFIQIQRKSSQIQTQLEKQLDSTLSNSKREVFPPARKSFIWENLNKYKIDSTQLYFIPLRHLVHTSGDIIIFPCSGQIAAPTWATLH